MSGKRILYPYILLYARGKSCLMRAKWAIYSRSRLTLRERKCLKQGHSSLKTSLFLTIFAPYIIIVIKYPYNNPLCYYTKKAVVL